MSDDLDIVLSEIRRALVHMENNELSNYIVPGLTSYLIGGPKHGRVRMFSASRETREFITPHSHRFNFTCLVLSGEVRNTIYRPGITGDEKWCLSTIGQVCGENGVIEYHHIRDKEPTPWIAQTTTYVKGNTYRMKHTELHSIQFSRMAEVLFFEGPQLTETSRMIEPWVNDKVVPTFRTEPWMFERGEAA